MKIFHNIKLTAQTIQNLGIFILDYLGMLSGDIVYTTRSGIKFVTRSGTPDKDEVVVVSSGDNYPLKPIHFPKHPVIVDLGAHIGSFSLPTANSLQHLSPIIYAFEPDSQNFLYLKTNIMLNQNKTIQPFNTAVSDHSGSGYLYTDTANDKFHVCSRQTKGTTPCTLLSLAQIIREQHIHRIELLKVDIEGEEKRLFNDATTRKILYSSVSYIYLEYHKESVGSLEKLIEPLQEHFQVISDRNNVALLANKIRQN